MIGGIVGDISGGSYIFDALTIELPVDSVSSTDYAISVSGGASLFLPSDSSTITDYAPTVDLILAIDLPTDNTSIEDFAPSVSGGASVALPLSTSTIADYPFTIEVIIRGVPRFYVNVSGTTATLTFTNREGKEIQIFRATAHNKEPSAYDFVSADTYNDTVDTDANDYGYRCRFVSRIGGSINASGQKSIKKITT